jgi:NAD(P)-dependent dehydrogenase (short-subunit alcohol dehydrogenase family)
MLRKPSMEPSSGMNTSTRKSALVTGAAKRLGRAIALGLAKDGWDIAVHYRASEAEALETVDQIKALGRAAIAIACDLSSEAETRQLLPRAMTQLGDIRCVVNSASLFSYDDAQSFDQTRLDAHMHSNLAAPILLAQALHAATPEDAQSVVINLLDQKLFNLNPDFLSYTLSKSALDTATKLLAMSLAPRLRVVGLAPGLTLVSGDQTESQFEKAHQQTVLGKSSTADDIAQAVCYLANAHGITGTTLIVDGGQHLTPMHRDVMFLAK